MGSSIWTPKLHWTWKVKKNALCQSVIFFLQRRGIAILVSLNIPLELFSKTKDKESLFCGVDWNISLNPRLYSSKQSIHNPLSLSPPFPTAGNLRIFFQILVHLERQDATKLIIRMHVLSTPESIIFSFLKETIIRCTAVKQATQTSLHT